MRYYRRLVNINLKHGRNLTVSIPKELADPIKGDFAILEPLPEQLGRGIMVRPGRVTVE